MKTELLRDEKIVIERNVSMEEGLRMMKDAIQILKKIESTSFRISLQLKDIERKIGQDTWKGKGVEFKKGPEAFINAGSAGSTRPSGLPLMQDGKFQK